MQRLRSATALALAHVLLYLPVLSCGRSDQASSVANQANGNARAVAGARAAATSASPEGGEAPSGRRLQPPAQGKALDGGAEGALRPYEEAVTDLEHFLSSLADLRRSIDRTQFDLEALGTALDFEAADIEGYVRDKIAYEAYPGLLRGARGTLMSRAGNSLDQAVLLATLLGDAGHDTRILRGTLSRQQASALLGEMSHPRSPPPPIGDRARIREALESLLRLRSTNHQMVDQLLDLAEQDIAVESSTPWARAGETAEMLRRELRRGGLALTPRPVEEELLAEAADYFWVEHRLGEGSPWQAAHPAFAVARSVPSGLAAREVYGDTIPEALQHRLRIRVLIERRLGVRTETVEVMAPWERPVANLAGIRLAFFNHPSGLQGFGEIDTETVAAATEYFVPSFAGAQAPGAQVFDLDGVTLSPDVVAADSFGAGAVFREVGSKVESAAAALSTLGAPPAAEGETPPDLRALTGQWIEYTLVSPGGGETTVRRTVLAAEEAPDPARAVWRLATHHGIAVAVGTLPPAYLFDRQLGRLIGLGDLLRWVLDKSYGKDQRAEPDSRWLAALEDFPELRYFDVFDAGAQGEPGALVYRGEPSLLVTRQGLVAGSGQLRVLAEVDIVHNRRRALRIDRRPYLSAPETALRVGAWETEIEGAGFLLPAEDAVRRVSAAAGLRQAAREVGGLRLLRPDEGREAASLVLPAEARAALRADLDDGYAVVLPRHLAAPEPTAATWWRVDPLTGETLGRGSDGRGIDMTEYAKILTLVSLGFAVLFGVGSFINCLENSPCTGFQCFGTATIGALLGFAFSYAIGLIVLTTLPADVALTGVTIAGVGTLSAAEAAWYAGSAVLFTDLVLGAASLALIPSCLK